MSLTPDQCNLELETYGNEVLKQQPVTESKPVIEEDNKKGMRIRYYPKEKNKLTKYYKISKEFLNKKASNILVGIIVTIIGRIILGFIFK